MHSCARVAFAALLIVGASSPVKAQEPRFHLAAKGGLTVENSEDGLTGTVPALGVTGAVAFTSNWRGEVEFWLAGYLKDDRGEPKHRDILYSFSAVRLFRAGTVRPFAVAGLSLSRTEDWFTFCSADRVPPTGGAPVRAMVSCDEPDVIDVRRARNIGTDGYLLAGGGVEIPLSPRVQVVADVRVSLAPVSVLVRPGVGVAIAF